MSGRPANVIYVIAVVLKAVQGYLLLWRCGSIVVWRFSGVTWRCRGGVIVELLWCGVGMAFLYCRKVCL